MLKLSQGIDPIDNSKTEDSVLHNERLAKCFAYVAEVLEKSISGEKSAPTKEKAVRSKNPFFIRPEQIQNISIKNEPCAVSELAAEINNAADGNDCKKLQAKHINDWLVANGYLENKIDAKGHNHRELSGKSSEIGIVSKQGMGTFGPYTIILYSEQAQRFIVDNLKSITEQIE